MTENSSPIGKRLLLVRSSLIVGAMTMVSRVLGLIRDIVFAGYFGANSSADAFFIAFKIPNFLRRLFGEGAFTQAFVPVLIEYRENMSFLKLKELIDRVCGVLGCALMAVTSIGVFAAPVIAGIFAPGFIGYPEKFELTVQLIRITFPYLFLISMTGFCGAILNSYERFATPAFTPVLLNLSLISAAIFFSPMISTPVMALAWGVLIAGLLQLLFQIPQLYRLNLLPRPTWDIGNPGVRKILKLMLPFLFGVSVSQVNLLLDTVIASFLVEGSVSWLYYSDRLVELPLGVFGVAVATVILPSLSLHKASEQISMFQNTLDWAIRLILFISIPASVALISLAEPILITLFKYGAMSSEDISMATLSLRAYSVGLVAFMLIKILVTGYFSRQDAVTPVRIGIIAMVANMLMNLIFVLGFLRFMNAGHVGLALATSMAAVLNAALLFRGLVDRQIFIFKPGWLAFSIRIFLATCGMFFVIELLRAETSEWLKWEWRQRIFQLSYICFAGFFSYLSLSFVFGTRPSQFASPLRSS